MKLARLTDPMPLPATEQEVVVALAMAMAPCPVWWGYAPAEDVETPPSLPLVVVVRSSAIVRTDWADMCEEPPADATPADLTLQIRAWHPNYGEARALQRSIRATLRSLTGWAEQGEFDVRDGDLRAWVISSDWLAVAAVLD
ncbi:MAG: hypothetical protein ACJ72W_01510 [Actinoallomurus sp.]